MKLLNRQPKNKSIIPAVNYHLWEPCNYKCHFCFATFQDVKKDMNLPKGHLPEIESISVVDEMAGIGFEKINFAGGEPTLCPWLPNLIIRAKKHGMVTSIVTNGSKITKQWLDGLDGSLDWIGLSIDTVDPEKLKRLGRARAGKFPMSEDNYLDVVEVIKQYKIRLKINTVVTSVTWDEDFTSFIKHAEPERWKLFQVLPIEGQNDQHIDDFTISHKQYNDYVVLSQVIIDGYSRFSFIRASSVVNLQLVLVCFSFLLFCHA
ncbi:viperin family antiviral radical SAM protein, partial [Candidatus Poribacteria bacterium]|nr:viperin family antiviral radical SAM protein [Candidatus Poribacteria bacterium]